MKKLHEYLGQPLKNGTLGVEIECEGQNLRIPEEKYWKTEADGSLRGAFPHGSAEYVLKGPMSLEKTKEALIHLNEVQKGAKLDFGFRTSVHVHLNMQDTTEDQFFNVVYTYFLLENTLLRYCGDIRIGNRFCLRLVDAEETLLYVKYLMKSGFDGLRLIDENKVRYAALNLGATRKYGSLEFRGMRGTMDPGILFPWFEAIVNIRKYALSKKNVIEIHQEFKELGTDIVWRVLGSSAEQFFHPHLRNDIAECFSVSYELITEYKKQQELKAKVKESEEKAKTTKGKYRAVDLEVPGIQVGGIHPDAAWPFPPQALREGRAPGQRNDPIPVERRPEFVRNIDEERIEVRCQITRERGVMMRRTGRIIWGD